jgi:hypothetical protein
MACTQCGSIGVNGICSMCYGDIDHNYDGFYRKWAEEQMQREEEQKYLEDQQYQIDTITNE